MESREKPLKAQPDVGKERPREPDPADKADRADKADKRDKSGLEDEPVQEKGGRDEKS